MAAGKKELLKALMEDAMSQLMEATKSLTSEEFYWKPQPKALSAEQAFAEELPPGIPTIGFKIAHIITSVALATDCLSGKVRLKIGDLSKQMAKDFSGWMEWFKEQNRTFQMALEMSSEEELEEKRPVFWGNEQYPAWQIWIWFIDHSLWHAGQIRTLRTLYQAAKSQ